MFAQINNNRPLENFNIKLLPEFIGVPKKLTN